MELSIFGVYAVSLCKTGEYKNLSESVKAMAGINIKSAELMTDDFGEFSFNDYKSVFNENNIRVLTVIAITTFASAPENYDEKIDELKRLIDFADKEGIKFIMVVPEKLRVNSTEEKLAVRDVIIKGMNELVAYASDKSVTLTMENYSLFEYPYSTIDEMEYIFKNVPGLKFNLDCGNFYCIEEDVIKAYDRLKNYIVNVHIKDFKEDESGSTVRPDLSTLDGCALGKGNIPLKEILLRLKEDNYNGSLVIEINSEKLCFEDIKESAEFVRDFINA